MQIDLNFPQRRERFRGAQEVRCVLARKYTAQVPRVDVPLVHSRPLVLHSSLSLMSRDKLLTSVDIFVTT
jgi:hypothetical protein